MSPRLILLLVSGLWPLSVLMPDWRSVDYSYTVEPIQAGNLYPGPAVHHLRPVVQRGGHVGRHRAHCLPGAPDLVQQYRTRLPTSLLQ